VVDNELTVKRLYRKGSQVDLHLENPRFPKQIEAAKKDAEMPSKPPQKPVSSFKIPEIHRRIAFLRQRKSAQRNFSHR
jgi:hypothetical protein